MSDPGKAVFLSYASQDAEAARRIAESLRASGVEVWFDVEGGLETGDEWDAKIRRQIKECVLFLPIISANTQAREEGYFRIEWELAAQRALGIASGVAFILPIVIDDTREPDALVPDRFRTVQWTRVRGGEMTPEAKAKFVKLWSHRAGVLKHQADVGASSREGGNADGRARGAPLPGSSPAPGWKVYAGLGVAIFALAGGATWWLLRPSPIALNSGPPPPAAPLKSAPVAARGGDLLAGKLGEEPAAPVVARDWPKHPDLKKAIDLIEGLESIPDDLALAEQLVKPILERSPADLEAVTVMARVQSQFMRRGFDRSDERSAQARLYGERALQLDPNEPEAMLAVATYLFARATNVTRAERLLRQAMERDPGNPRHGRMLADLLNVQPGRQAEALAQSQENVRRFPRDALSRYDLARHYKDQGRYEEFDRELDATLALTPLPNAIAWKARLQFGLHNDFPGMKRWLDQVPERVRGTERAVFGYFLYAAFGGDVEAGLDALRAFTQKWFTDFEYAGPTALLNADLLVRQGKAELARQQYEAAWLEIQRMRTTEPARIWLNYAEFWTLLGLGRKTEAKVAFGRLVEAQRRPYAQSLVTGWWFTLIPGALLIGERDTALEFLREGVVTWPEGRTAIRVRMQLDPRMAPWRDDPEIRAILAEPRTGE
ncbi:cellulose synthase subunit BcsC [Lacunisphaera limnophila]|uniref:Cellulose synthase subunit BcsC n=1 Tax=Lacunisphaera limnophila TaxID=1838286 RepID=A0A1D8ARY8_9BACT|nr:toll/interleukin-1 receptor domain-containing protein [Lacunisphaera limnophila]AOS43661.1 cellulose synthase subunit BcsC [Lacunisphaera limnophila]